MASRNSIKIYSENSYYHLYNRGVEKRLLFLDNQDYAVFLNYLKEYLLPKDEETLRSKLMDPQTSYKEKNKILKLLRLNNFYGEIKLLAYCLMPNHFHLLIYQLTSNTIDKFMNSLCLRYAMYFNRKYTRIGSLFQDVYKAAKVSSNEQLIYLTKYIHRNSLDNKLKIAMQEDVLYDSPDSPDCISQPSSFPEYLGQRKTVWINSEEILTFFSNTNPQLSYESFVTEKDDSSVIQQLLIDS